MMFDLLQFYITHGYPFLSNILDKSLERAKLHTD